MLEQENAFKDKLKLKVMVFCLLQQIYLLCKSHHVLFFDKITVPKREKFIVSCLRPPYFCINSSE